MGRHLIADLAGLSGDCLRDAARIMAVLSGALGRAGFHCLETVEHRFDGGGGGFTGVILLAESHASVHTYPELGYLALDIFTCGPRNPRGILEEVSAELRPAEVHALELSRSPEAGPQAP